MTIVKLSWLLPLVFFTEAIFGLKTDRDKQETLQPHVNEIIESARKDWAAASLAEMLVAPADAMTFSKVAQMFPFCNAQEQLIRLLQSSRFVIISAGPNTKLGEDSNDPFLDRNSELEQELATIGYPYHETQGRYFGTVERSFIVELPGISRGSDQIFDEVESFIRLGNRFNQDSIIYSSHGNHFMIYTNSDESGDVKRIGSLNYGQGVRISHEPIGNDNYSQVSMRNMPFFNYDISAATELFGRLAVTHRYFTLDFNFDKSFSSFVDWNNANLKDKLKKYEAFSIIGQGSGNLSSMLPRNEVPNKTLILVRGLEEYDSWANMFMIIAGRDKVAAVGTDAHILLIQKEFAEQGKSYEWREVRDEAIHRNTTAVKNLMEQNVPYVIYADMNLRLMYMERYVNMANEHGYQVVVVKTTKEVRSPHLPFMERHKEGLEAWDEQTIQICGKDLPQIDALVYLKSYLGVARY